MSIERDGTLIRFTCDERGCRKNYEVYEDTTEFNDAWREARHYGWVSAHGNDGWKHYCPKCKLELGDD